jgi:hypothetical protein
MVKPFEEWTVLPHEELVCLDDNLLSATGHLNMPPVGEVERRMTVVRLANSRLVVFSAIALDEPEMAALEGYGTPSYLIVPNELHRMDAKIWKERYPHMQVIAPAGARAKVEEVVKVDDIDVDFGDPLVHFITVPGTGAREAALLVEAMGGTTLILNDLVFNLRHRPGLRGWLLQAMGMSGDEPHMPPVIKMRQVSDELALSAQFDRWARLPNLKRIMVSHGKVISDEPARVLGRIADELAA